MGFSEILLIKPKLDSSEAAKMENDLNGRFSRVATKVGKGLFKAMLGGGVIAAALTAINRLLNPLEEVEERIKSLLGQSDTISDTADKFGTTAGKFFKLQQLGHVAGLDDAGLKDLLTKFQTAQELARKEMADPSQGTHRSTVAIGQFANEKDVASAFFRAMQDMQNQDKATRDETQRSIFGETLSGGAKRFAALDFNKESKQLGVQDSNQLDEAFKKTGSISALSKGLEAQRNIQAFTQGSQNMSPEMVKAIDEIEKAKITREAQQLDSIKDLKTAAVTIESIKGLIDTGLKQVEKLLALLAPIAPFLDKISQGRGIRIGGFQFGGKK
jgi:flagellar motor protein MotB